jgi:hypothetical protein
MILNHASGVVNMRKIWIWLLWVIPFSCITAQWSDPVIISDGYSPDFAIDPNNGHLHVVAILDGVVYTETDETGHIITPSQVIPGTSKDVEYWSFGATVAVDQAGFPHVCFRVPKGDNHYDLYYTRKTASGWLKNPLLVSSNRDRGYMVRMAVDSNNKVHVVQGYQTGNIIGPVSYFRIRDNMVEYSIADLNPASTYYRTDNRIEITVDKNNAIYVIAGCPGIPNLTYEGPVTYFRSTDGGNTFQRIADIHNSNCIDRNAAPDIAVDELGIAHMVYGAKIDIARNSKPSLRYVRYGRGKKLLDLPITDAGALKPWGYPEGYDPIHGKNYGLGSIAVSNDGEVVIAAYITCPSFYSSGVFYQGDLFVTLSSDSGATWNPAQLLAEDIGSNEGRNVHLIRSYKNHFYVIYPHNVKPKKIKMRYLRNLGDTPPKANSGGPYTANEGALFTLDASASTDLGQNRGIVKYEWDLNNDGIFDYSDTEPQMQISMPDDYFSVIRVQVTDRAGYTDGASTTLRINNVAPTVDAGADLSIDEGGTIGFHCTITDPGLQDTHTFLWDFGDGETSVNSAPDHVYRDDGNYQVTITVTDDNNGSAQDAVNVTVRNVPPVVDAGGPYQAAINVPILFSGFASDPGIADQLNLTFTWDLNNDTYYETQGQNPSYAFDKEGVFKVWLKVRDNLAFSIDSAWVTISNDPPQISAMTNQTVPEGVPFQNLVLDDYVNDPDQEKDELSWSVSGQKQLLPLIQNRILSVTQPDTNWFGSESLTLKVIDPGGLSDSTQIIYTVTPVNDPPIWVSPVPDFAVNEDTDLFIPLDTLWQWVADIDDPDPQLSFTIQPQTGVVSEFITESKRYRIRGNQDWNGSAELIFTVTDTSGLAAIDTCRITVIAVPDQPADFSLIQPMLIDSTNNAWPDSILFIWHATYDPDNPGGLIYYTMTLSNLDGPEIQTFTLFDTSTVFEPDPLTLSDGRYTWQVRAFTSGGLSVASNNIGFIIIGHIDTGTGIPVTEIPETFALKQNYPNPFNPVTQIVYHVPQTSNVEISVYNSLGENIISLVKEEKSPGVYTVSWPGVNQWGQKVTSGLYICRMQAGQQVFFKKMILLQ